MEKDYTVGSTNAAPIKENEISRVLFKLHKTVDGLSVRFGDLEQRISPILSPVPPSDVRENSVNPEFSTNLAQEINSAIRKLTEVCDFVEKTHSRIEL